MYVYDLDQSELLVNVIREILLCTTNVFKTFEEGVSGICSQRNQAFCSPTTSKNTISRHQEHTENTHRRHTVHTQSSHRNHTENTHTTRAQDTHRTNRQN